MANPEQVGSFVPTTNIWSEAQRLASTDVNSAEFKQLLVNMYQNIGLIATVLNTKDTGYYAQSEFVNGQIYFPDPSLDSTSQLNPVFRQVFRMVINFGALPNATTKSVPHDIPMTDAVTFTRIYGASSDTTGNSYIPLPYVDVPAGDHIGLNVDAINVNVSTTIDRTNYTITYIVLEYLKQ